MNEALSQAVADASAVAVLDLQTLHDLIGCDAAIVNELLADFAALVSQYAASLDDALQAHDAHAVCDLAHKLKSAARSVGTLALGEACATLETAAHSGVSALTPSLQRHFKHAMNAAICSVQAHLEQTSPVEACI